MSLYVYIKNYALIIYDVQILNVCDLRLYFGSTV